MRRAIRPLAFSFAASLLLTGPAPAEDHGGAAPAPRDPSRRSPGSRLVDRLEVVPLDWKVPEVGREVERFELPEGTIVYLLEDRALPIVEIEVRFRTGTLYEPRNGVAALTGALLRQGGTASRTPDEVDRALEMRAITLTTGIGDESGSATLDCMKKDLAEGLDLLADIVRNPRFDEGRIELQRGQMIESIRRRNDNPGAVSGRVFQRALYGEHPYGRTLEWEPLLQIRREDLVDFHARYFVPNNAMVAVSGDIGREEFTRAWTSAFSGWKRRAVEFPPVPAVAQVARPGITVVRKDLNQSNIRLGHLGIDWWNPDRHAVNLMNFVLGGGSFTSRLTEKVRSDEGLAYSVGSQYGARRDLGTFQASCQTKTGTTAKAVRIILGEIERMRSEGVTEAELRRAKDSFLNRYVFQFNDAAAVVSQLMDLELTGRPRDLLSRYISDVQAVTAEQVNAAARKYLRPEAITIVVVGNPDGFDESLASLGIGPVATLQLEDPPPPMEDRKSARDRATAAGGAPAGSPPPPRAKSGAAR